MTRTLLLCVSGIALSLTGCGEETAREQQANRGAARAQQVIEDISSNAEQDNIERRLRLTSQPGLLGFIVLLNESGQPILYTGVKGKVTSSGKRLTSPEIISNSMIRAGPSDEGTFGSSDPYVYFWTSDGQYMQWNGKYLYSNSPIRLRVEPLVVSLGEPAAPEPK